MFCLSLPLHCRKSSELAADLQCFWIGLYYFRTRFCQNTPMCKRQGTSTLFLNSKQRRQPHDKLLLSDLLLLYVQKLFFSFQRRAFWRLNEDLRFPVDTHCSVKENHPKMDCSIKEICRSLIKDVSFLEHIIIGLELKVS